MLHFFMIYSKLPLISATEWHPSDNSNFLPKVTHTVLITHIYHKRCQNLKQVPQNLMKVLSVDDIKLTPKIITSYRKTNITGIRIINYRVIITFVNVASLLDKHVKFLSWYVAFYFEDYNTFMSIKRVYKDVTVRSLDYLNRCIVKHLCCHHYVNQTKS